MTKLYNAVNPQEIIDQFERRAENAARMEANAATKIGRESYLSEKLAWRAAADILRQTEFIGWPAASITDTTHLDALKFMAERTGEALDKRVVDIKMALNPYGKPQKD